METNAATCSGNPHISSTIVTTEAFSPPNQPSPTQTTMVSTASNSRNGMIPTMMAITDPFNQSATGPPFSYGMPSFDMNYVVSYSTLQTLGLRAWSSNALFQGSMGGISALYNYFPYGGGHIPPLSSSLNSSH
jgi:hypothetical protein